MKISGIYAIVQISSGRKYIGQSSDLLKRFSRNRWCLNKGKHSNRLLQESWDVCGAEDFSFEILEMCPIAELASKEKTHLLQTPEHLRFNLANQFEPNNRGQKFSKESRARMRGGKRLLHVLAVYDGDPIRIANSSDGLGYEHCNVGRRLRGEASIPGTCSRCGEERCILEPVVRVRKQRKILSWPVRCGAVLRTQKDRNEHCQACVNCLRLRLSKGGRPRKQNEGDNLPRSPAP